MNLSTQDLFKIRAHLKEQILHSGNVVGHETERKQILKLLKRTSDNGESNSILLIGPRGVGKTTLINDVLNELQTQKWFNSNAVVVRLHGLLHTDDRLALKSITSQMNLENAVDGKVFGSFGDNLSFLLACLGVGDKETAKSIFFVLEEFDLFCAHHNQTLLYNLFDVSQSKQTPVCVLGITCRLDIIELFEKRVKSRFSHRQVFVFEEPNSVEARINRVRHLLSCSKNTEDLSPQIVSKWNAEIERVVNDSKFRALMRHLTEINSNQQILMNILMVLVSKLDKQTPELTVADFEAQIRMYERDDLTHVIQDLSILGLCLLIAMKHHTEIYDGRPFNFEMIHARYTKFASTNSNVQAVQRSAVLKVFQHLQKLELISPAATNTNTGEYRLFRLLVTFQQITDAVRSYGNLPTEIKQWMCSSIM